MALKATVHKASLQVSDMDRGYYADLNLTIARHPSETDERMMVRLLAFALNASDDLHFTRGLCVDEEPEIWQKDLSGGIDLWIEVGLPQEKRLRKACSRSELVRLYAYGGRSAALWWEKNAEKLSRLENLTIINLPREATREMAGLARRSMTLHCSIQDGIVLLGDQASMVTVELEGFSPLP